MSSTPLSSPARSPAPAIRPPLPREAPKESAISRLLIAPLTFFSFLLSLALIDSHNYRLRTHSHSPSRSQPTTFFGRFTNFLHGLIFKQISDSPYNYVKSPSSKEIEREGNSSPSRSGSGKGREKEGDEPWHWHTKQKQMMKAEISDAFRVRKWVVVALIGVSVCGLVMGLMVCRWVVVVWGRWRGCGERRAVYGMREF